MEIREHRDLAIVCREHGYVKLAEYHEKRARDIAAKRKT